MGVGRRTAARALSWPLAPVMCVLLLLVQGARPGPFIAAGTSSSDVAGLAPFLAAEVTCWLVGVLLTGRAFTQLAGWAFLGLGTAMAWSALTDVYTQFAFSREAHGVAFGGALMAVLSDTSFVWWFLFLALGLQFTPAARPTHGLWRLLPRVSVVSAVLFQLFALLRSAPIKGFDGLVSPWAIGSLPGPMRIGAFVSIMTLGLCLLASVVVLVVAFRRSRGESRQQLLWLVAGALPVAPCLVASFAASFANHDSAAGWIMSLAIISLALGAGLSIARYRLYDVERIVTDSAAYAMASGAVIAVFAVVVVVITKSIPVGASSQIPTILATLAGVGVARPAYVGARRRVDRRFNRRRYDALLVVRAGLTAGPSDLDALLAGALDDPNARLLFPAKGESWVTADGRPAVVGSAAVEVVRVGRVGARVEFNPQRTERHVVAAVAQQAAAEIDNLGLRAELARQVEQLTESRSRLASAHLEERRRMERDLHDGAQQRILAIALQLQSARVNGADGLLRDEVDRAISHLGLTVQELRDLASGLQPAALAGGGLRAATEDLANRIPIRMRLQVVDQRFETAIEGAAWFVIAEAVSNAVKHAAVDEVAITVSREATSLHVAVTDEGIGGADARGSGLQGLADRVSALGGVLSAGDNEPRGTKVEAVFPCG